MKQSIRMMLSLAIMLVVGGCAGQVETSGQQVERSLAQDFVLFQEWFQGEYDNHEQVWQQKVNGIEEKDLHEHIHHIFMPVAAPQVGEKTYFVKQYMDGDYENVYRQRLYQFSLDEAEDAIKLVIYSFKDEKKYRYADRNPELLSALSPEEVKNTAGCEVYWRHNGSYFDGYMKDKACHFFSSRSNKTIYITDTLRLTDSEIWIGDKAFDDEGNKVFGRDEQHKNRKVRYFNGWMGLKRQTIDPSAAEDDWVFMKDVRIHNEGQTLPITDKDGNKTGYSVQLAQLTYQNTTQPILKLGLIEDKTGKTVTYIWSNTEANRIGMNLRWMQAGFTSSP